MVRALTARLEAALVALTINAPTDDPAEWDSVYAARIARDMLWRAPENVALRDWVLANQTYVFVPSPPPRNDPANRLIDVFAQQRDGTGALVRYYSLLHCAGLTHRDLNAIHPGPALPGRARALGILAGQALSPRVAFLPMLIAHAPAYAFALIATRFVCVFSEATQS